MPTLISPGTSDAIVTFGVSGRRSHETIADSSLVLIEGAPHGFNAAHPERFNRARLGFLS